VKQPPGRDIGATALQRGDAVFGATTSRQLQRAVGDFVAALRTIPDGPPGETAEVTLQQLPLVAERVIQRIEDHLATVSDRETIQRRLAAAIYELRRTLEELDHWRRHYGR
jgi:hypothetical protein